MLLEDVLGEKLKQCFLEEVKCGLECTSQVCRAQKRLLGKSFVLCCRPQTYMQCQPTVVWGYLHSCWLRARYVLGHLTHLPVFMDHLFQEFWQREGFQETSLRVIGTPSQMVTDWLDFDTTLLLTFTEERFQDLSPCIRDWGRPWRQPGTERGNTVTLRVLSV